ncbi:MAG: hypothetical protein RR706_05920, partial [Muribaculaceae bacterium]
MKIRSSRLRLIFIMLCGIVIYSAYNFFAYGQYVTSTLPPPPPANVTPPAQNSTDSIAMPFPVQPTVPSSYEEVMN